MVDEATCFTAKPLHQLDDRDEQRSREAFDSEDDMTKPSSAMPFHVAFR
ncbi:hypothetical protein CA13_67470 [Planctomycetes bacterium CA13]|uniref:Uncharacterized protein n=1 Tax=Novipirellula herctigrandis TaxID=2527986 RepID=A0A5C5YN10_9BACT|nr:hypothetical protein CA13_67470 [Planctomycetes bacterium CA13]